MRRLLRYLRPYKPQVALALAAIISASVLQLAQPYLMKLAIDRYIASGDLAGINRIAVAFLAILVASFILEYAQMWTLQMTGQRIMFDLRMQIYGHLQRIDLQFYDRNPVGRLMTRVTTDVDVHQRHVHVRRRLDFRRHLHAARHHDRARHDGLAARDRRLRRAAAHRARDAMVPPQRARVLPDGADAGSRASTPFSRSTSPGCRRCSCSGAKPRSFGRFDDVNRKHRDANIDSILFYAVFYPAIEIIGALASALIIWFGGRWTLQGTLTLGSLVAFLLYSRQFFRPISDMSEKFNVLQAAMASSERIFKLLDTPVQIETRHVAGESRTSVGAVGPGDSTPGASVRAAGHIVFDHVWFAYNTPARPSPTTCCGTCRSRSGPASASAWSGRRAPASRR